DADKEGFLRSESALIQTTGRAARNSDGKVIMYADKITGSMRRAIDETNRRRDIQHEYNVQNGITPKTIVKEIRSTLEITSKADLDAGMHGKLSEKAKATLIEKLTADMKKAAKTLDFETAAALRDKIKLINSK
ncbi:MAG: UvrB/UvrC motif-containing protein, partial [Eubacteriales bacterium]|nr:UvrB/UvrC motif-containing protein [Eubacteriales bacterium]